MYLLANRSVLYLLAIATFLHICQAKSVAAETTTVNTTDGSLWQPKEGTRSEWMACHGMRKDVCQKIKIKKHELHKAIAKKFGLGDIGYDSSLNDRDVGKCIMFTEEQLDAMIADAKKDENTTSTHRTKRSLVDLKRYPSSKWPMPVPYMFDGTHTTKQKETIRGAFQHWMDNTCVRFRELPTRASFVSNYILMTSQRDGCYSYVGRTNLIPQAINLEPVCIEEFGSILHEIGHSLGLFHEQSRIDRDDSVEIIWSNIEVDAWDQYMKAPTNALGLPYNFGSVMHYPSKGGNSVDGGDTMSALEPLYQMNMGQRSDLSFHDRKIINLAYCNGTCLTPLSQLCQQGGYQDPNNCSTCICPDGFSGQYCDQIARPLNAQCGGVLNIDSGTQQIIKSPGYDDGGYSERQECTWWIKAPKNYTMELTFSGDFSIYCDGFFFHWVEIKYKKDLGLDGARFCCYRRPSDIVTSESNEMMVIFRSNHSVGLQGNNTLRGFQAIVKPIPPRSSSSRPTTTRASNSRTSTSVSTRKFSSTTSTGRTTSSLHVISTSACGEIGPPRKIIIIISLFFINYYLLAVNL